MYIYKKEGLIAHFSNYIIDFHDFSNKQNKKCFMFVSNVFKINIYTVCICDFLLCVYVICYYYYYS